jgi:SPP1 gp7 family putative phage head morphogenesis protein
MLAVRHLSQTLDLFHQHYSLDLTPPPLAVASKLSERLMVERFASSAARWSKRSVDAFKRNLAIGSLRGESVEKMTDRMLGLDAASKAMRGADLEQKAEFISREQFRRMRNDVRQVVRTELIGAYNRHAEDGIKQTADEDPRMMKRWVAELDARTCDDCGDLDEEVVGVDENFPGAEDGDPPLHPNCRCTVVAWREDWEEQKTKRQEAEEESAKATPEEDEE